MKNVHDLFRHELRAAYNAEIQMEKALPEFVKASHDKDLKEAFRHHHEETKHQIQRLEKIARDVELDLKGVESEPMKVLIREGEKMIKTNYPPEVKDAALISYAQRIEHYEIACYGTLKAFAHHLDFKEAEKLLNETLQEEEHADKKLNALALGGLFSAGINQKAIDKTA
jgi:ferritin-like metal-binding protein YciE